MAFRVPQTWDNTILGNLGSSLKTTLQAFVWEYISFSFFFGSERNV